MNNDLRLPRRSLGGGLGLALGRPEESKEAKDKVVQQTDQDASQSRLSAVVTGYLEDKFVGTFVGKEVQRRYPLINRGTYVRTTAIDMLVNRFISSTPSKKQIISLGAGSDTRYFRLLDDPATANSIIYHEFDFAAVTSQKIASIIKSPAITSLVSDPALRIDQEAGTLYSPRYSIHPFDLRSLQPGCKVPEGIDPSLPTLFISECCLIYLSPEEADNILKWITRDFSGAAGIILYEPIGGDDAFGKVMVQNLAARGIVLKTLKRYSSLGRQKERLRVLGFSGGQEAADVDYIHDYWVSAEERERIAGLEMLDEVEEWQLLARHYCIAWGWRGQAQFECWREAFPLQKVAD
ncbi:carboxy methyl transferase for protein phosphatase 2A [Rhizina undulata]